MDHSPTPGAGDPDLLLAAEGVGVLLGAPSLVLLLVALVLVGSASLLSRVADAGLRLGIDRGQSAARLSGLLKLLGWLVGIFVLLRGLSAPFSASATLLLLASAFVTLALTGVLRDLAGSLYAQFRLRLGEGDQVAFGDTEAQIRRIHWDHLSLRTADGKALLLPGRQVFDQPLHVQPLRQAELLELRFAGNLPVAAIDRVRDAAAVSPYRIGDTPLGIDVGADGVVVTLYTWSREGHGPLLRQLRAVAAAAMEGEDDSPPKPQPRA